MKLKSSHSDGGLRVQREILFGLPVILHNGIQIEDAGENGKFMIEMRRDSEEGLQHTKAHLKAAGLRKVFGYYDCGLIVGSLFLNPDTEKSLRALLEVSRTHNSRIVGAR